MRLTVLSVPQSDAELAADLLWIAGAGAVEEITEVDGSVQFRTVLAAEDAASRARLGAVPDTWQVAFVDADDVPSRAWRDHAHPIVVNADLIVSPAWLADPMSGVTGINDGRCTVAIEPGGAFGLGDHPTTRLSCDAIWRRTRPGTTVLDVGSGSGVLAIVALLRGAGHAMAIDVAETARESTIANAVLNSVGERVTASCDALADVEGEFDLVLANILAPTLIELADDLRRVLAPGGCLIVSGVLAERYQHVLAALAPLAVDDVRVLEAWACLELVSPGN